MLLKSHGMEYRRSGSNPMAAPGPQKYIKERPKAVKHKPQCLFDMHSCAEGL